MFFIDANKLFIRGRNEFDISGREYLESLGPTTELLLEKFFKRALDKNKERWQRKLLQTSQTPAGLGGDNDQKKKKVEPFSDSDVIDFIHYELPFANGFPEESTPLTRSRRPRSLLQKLLHCSPIVDGILSLSSASTIANLYYVAGVERPAWVNRYITLLRDIFSPPELEQVHRMCREDYSFIFLGKDLHKMQEKLQDPEKYYSNPNRPSKLRIWMLMATFSPSPRILSAQSNPPMPITFPPGKWLNRALCRFAYIDSPTFAMKWNTDPDIHVEWHDHYNCPPHLTLPLEVSTSWFMWNWNEAGDVPLLDYIDVGRHPNVVQKVPFKHVREFRDRSERFRGCMHMFFLRLGDLAEPMEDWSFHVPIFPRCKNPECQDGSICFRLDQSPCVRSRDLSR